MDNPDRLLAIINHVQLPAVQVTVTTKEQDKKLTGLMGEEIVIAQHLPNYEGWKVGQKPAVKMLAGWMHFVLYRQVTGSTAGQDNCAKKFGCGATPFKRIIMGKWQECSKRKEEPKGKSEAKKTRSLERLKDIGEH